MSAGGRRALIPDTDTAGFYRIWHAEGGNQKELFAVNFDPDESDLDPIGEKVLAARFPEFAFGYIGRDTFIRRWLTRHASKNRSMQATLMLARTSWRRKRPESFRSSVSKANPCLMATCGEVGLIGRPLTTMVPDSGGTIPKSDSTISVRPAPIKPEIPRISPP